MKERINLEKDSKEMAIFAISSRNWDLIGDVRKIGKEEEWAKSQEERYVGSGRNLSYYFLKT